MGDWNKTIEDCLVECLEDLKEYDFKRCKDKLSEFRYEDRSAIPRGHLEHANRIDTKNLLIKYYQNDTALNVLVQVLEAIQLMEPAYKLKKKGGQIGVALLLNSNFTTIAPDPVPVTSKVCFDIIGFFKTNRSLTYLNLRGKNLQDSGVKYLCEQLKRPNSNVQEMSLVECGLTSACCKDLRSVIITNRSLTKIELSNNKLHDNGIKCLCEGLRHPDCTLRELGLWSCDLTSGCCEDLRSVIITNRSLIKLDLNYNNLQDSGRKILFEGLRHPGCTLQELSLDGEGINIKDYQKKFGLKR
ncbi:NACHT, LRR and PYD domains-containing protein 3-like [Ascaphus truei]|uniref:NACHT, LRR and PYD domains-containing protein 3-like n=1 Tax=Ascaphus truei TaxID=8439 RepID=UPI003F59F79F